MDLYKPIMLLAVFNLFVVLPVAGTYFSGIWKRTSHKPPNHKLKTNNKTDSDISFADTTPIRVNTEI